MSCPKSGCANESNLKSTKGYCTWHMAQAKAAFAERVAASKAAAADREDRWGALHAKAHLAGMTAGQAVIPEPMYPIRRANPFDESSPIVRRYEPVLDGVCGFAWVLIRPGSCSFARWLVKHQHGRSAYGGGVSMRVGHFDQSLTRKEAYAQAYADVVGPELGTARVYAQSRMD